MRQQFLAYLADPLSFADFELISLEESGSQVISGILLTDHSWYPVIGGIPRILVAELKLNLLQQHQEFFTRWKHRLPKKIQVEWRGTINEMANKDQFLHHQRQTAASFAFEWRTIYRENSYEEQNFFHFLHPFITGKDFFAKLTIDIGCGSGRFTKQAALAGAKVAFGTDLGESVVVAYELTKELENVCIVQADIYHMPFRRTFNFAYSIGVLHHLPQPESGFKAALPVLKIGGQMLIWVYNRRSNARAIYLYEPLRAFLKHLPASLLHRISYLPALAVHSLNSLTHLLKALRVPALAKRIPFSYYANFPFNMKLNDAFDVLATPKSNYYLVEEIRQWFRDARLTKIRTHQHPEAGITAIGTYES